MLKKTNDDKKAPIYWGFQIVDKVQANHAWTFKF